MKIIRVAVIFFLIGAAAFLFYLAYLYQHVDEAFTLQDEYLPTRFYSDAIQIVPSQSRAFVLNRLTALGYKPQIRGNTLSFTLHPIDYPEDLIPQSQAKLEKKLLSLEFENNTASAHLKSIKAGQAELQELYLEPELVATLSREQHSQIRDILSFSEIPAPVWKAIISIEDQNFLKHKGLDPRGIARAIFINLKTFSLKQGGSTITQQLVKNLMARRTRNIFKKFNELFLAILLEFKYDKEQILERYLNEVYLGQIGNLEVHGVSEGAKYFFGKRLNELNLAETALMAGLIRGPAFYSPYRHFDRATSRQRLVLDKMVETGHLAPEEAEQAKKLSIHLAPPPTATNKAPYFTDYVKAQLLEAVADRMTEEEVINAGFKVYTTIDTWLNQSAQQAVAKGVARVQEQAAKLAKPKPKKKRGQKAEPEPLANPLDELRVEGALASVDPSNGFIRALIGGSSYRTSTFNRILNMKRQVGSTFKPIVYLSALQKGKDADDVSYGPAYPVEDAPWTIQYDNKRQSWTPKNYEKEFLGWISFTDALILSINTIAARIGNDVGLDRIIQTARDLGITSALPKVPSLTLGVAELSPIELLTTYSTLANRGIRDDLIVIRQITHRDGRPFAHFEAKPFQAVDAAYVDLLTHIMKDVFTRGTAKSASQWGFKNEAAGKTGTTSNHRDSWFAGYTPQIATVVWVGYDRGQIKKGNRDRSYVKLSGAGSALPIWVDYMNQAAFKNSFTPFAESEFLTDVKIDRHTGQKASVFCPEEQVVIEKYVKGEEPSMTTCETQWPKKEGVVKAHDAPPPSEEPEEGDENPPMEAPSQAPPSIRNLLKMEDESESPPPISPSVEEEEETPPPAPIEEVEPSPDE